jgi:hypothetical protein
MIRPDVTGNARYLEYRTMFETDTLSLRIALSTAVATA